MRYRLFSLLILCCALPLTALAAAKKPAADAAPAARPVYETNGLFSFCLLDYNYPDNRKVTFALSQQGEVNLGVTIPNAGFKLGGHYDLMLGFDNGEAHKIRSTAVEADSLLLQLGSNPDLLKALTASKLLKLSAAGKTMEFPVATVAGAFSNLQQCNKNNKDKTNPAAAKIEQALPETLKALLVSAGFTDIEPLSMDDIPPAERPADFVWRTGKLLGGVREREVPKGKSLTELVGLHIDGLKKKCNGAFKAQVDKEEVAGALTLRPALVECQMKDNGQSKDVVVAMLFYLAAGNHFTLFTHEATAADQPAALAARDQLKRTLIDLAQQSAGKKQP